MGAWPWKVCLFIAMATLISKTSPEADVVMTLPRKQQCHVCVCVGMSPGETTGLNLGSYLYVGGVKQNVRVAPGVGVEKGLMGCVKEVSAKFYSTAWGEYEYRTIVHNAHLYLPAPGDYPRHSDTPGGRCFVQCPHQRLWWWRIVWWHWRLSQRWHLCDIWHIHVHLRLCWCFLRWLLSWNYKTCKYFSKKAASYNKFEFYLPCFYAFIALVTGVSCELDTRVCVRRPCQNNAQCVPVAGGTYKCNCPLGFIDRDCQTGTKKF